MKLGGGAFPPLSSRQEDDLSPSSPAPPARSATSLLFFERERSGREAGGKVNRGVFVQSLVLVNYLLNLSAEKAV